jgi:hypothetical protein
MKTLTPDQKLVFADASGTSLGYINLLSGGFRRPSPDLVKRMVIASNGELTRESLRPDIYDEMAA